ncbi:inactive peptidyl-prolyl cis-trans isomerase FKBP6-like isoform X1 [Lingula anatina]|uniref:peptidylprolyl isomerase n=1 Tax=Lingula anatina TaxID=7574 RepID=A0A1S3J5B1_LINAN|nr:inactive peptidyl-prolyl cis-trans isomerase FKBP6-like isoform X1 [Lingula anatina]|eukprot:XP_013405451.1 inactive peptidyl-prolyl cis-trans isomerase FKBP6-like isoform X1 [Lingula anatina]
MEHVDYDPGVHVTATTETNDEVEELEDDSPEDLVSLKQGLDLAQLQQGDGTVFEVDENGLVEKMGIAEAQEKEYFSKEAKLAVYSSVAECGLPDDDESTEQYHSDDDNDTDDESGPSPFQLLARNMQDLTPPEGGVLKQVLKPGTGDVVPKEAFVQVHYNGYLEYSGEPFDSTRLRDRQFRFQLGKGDTIMGLEIAVSSMRKGELARFIFSYKYAYGERGCPPRIGEKADVMFEVELLNFYDQGAVDAFYEKTEEERRNAPLSEILRVVQHDKQKAGELFNKQKYRPALNLYRKIIRTLEGVHLQNDDEEKEQQDLLQKVYLNSANCNTKLSRNADAVRDCKMVMEKDRNNVKAMYLRAKALYQDGKFDGAINWIKRAQAKSPNNTDINNLLGKINDDMNRFRQLEIDVCKRMFSQPGPKEDPKKESESSKGNCSEEFKRSSREGLLAFKNNPNLEEMPFTVATFSKEEIACVLEIAEELGLVRDVNQKGGILTVKFLKKKGATDDVVQ